MTFQKYLEQMLDKKVDFFTPPPSKDAESFVNIVHYVMRAEKNDKGEVTIHFQPAGRDGAASDFKVSGNTLTPVQP